MTYEHPERYTAKEGARLAYLLARGGKVAAGTSDTSKWDREIDALRAAAVERERAEKEAAAKEKAAAQEKARAARTAKRAESRWW